MMRNENIDQLRQLREEIMKKCEFIENSFSVVSDPPIVEFIVDVDEKNDNKPPESK